MCHGEGFEGMVTEECYTGKGFCTTITYLKKRSRNCLQDIGKGIFCSVFGIERPEYEGAIAVKSHFARVCFQEWDSTVPFVVTCKYSEEKKIFSSTFTCVFIMPGI